MFLTYLTFNILADGFHVAGPHMEVRFPPFHGAYYCNPQ